jgi:hypothetical protein
MCHSTHVPSLKSSKPAASHSHTVVLHQQHDCWALSTVHSTRQLLSRMERNSSMPPCAAGPHALHQALLPQQQRRARCHAHAHESDRVECCSWLLVPPETSLHRSKRRVLSWLTCVIKSTQTLKKVVQECMANIGNAPETHTLQTVSAVCVCVSQPYRQLCRPYTHSQQHTNPTLHVLPHDTHPHCLRAQCTTPSTAHWSIHTVLGH